MSTLNRTFYVVAYDDLPSTNNPQRRLVDWRRSVQGIPVTNPRSQALQIEAFQEALVFDGTRSLTYDGTTQFALSLSPLDPSRYRLAWTGTGAAPGFRTNRGLTLSGGDITLTLNANATVTATHTAGAVFGSVVDGDVVLVPGESTGDTTLFNPLNEGFWSVLSASASSLVLVRMPDELFTGATETVTLTTNVQFQAFSATGVQVGDTLDFVSGFAATARHAYTVLAASASWVEFVSVNALAAQTVIPGANSLQAYSAAKKYLMVETDQEVALLLNGSTDEALRVEPILPGDSNKVGFHEHWGTTFSLSIKNRSSVRVNVFVVSAE